MGNSPKVVKASKIIKLHLIDFFIGKIANYIQISPPFKSLNEI